MSAVKVRGPNIAIGLRTIHAIITRAIDVISDKAQTLPDDPSLDSLAQGFGDYVSTLSKVLTAHHVTEDEVGFPFFRPLIPDAPFDRLQEQHLQMQPLIDRLAERAGGLGTSAGRVGALADIAGTIEALDFIWRPHIETEESYLTPERVESLVPPDENARLNALFAQYTQEKAQPPSMVVPFLLFNLPPDMRHAMAAGMPDQVVNELVPGAWMEQWQPMAPFLLV